MSRHVLTLQEPLEGVRAALKAGSGTGKAAPTFTVGQGQILGREHDGPELAFISFDYDHDEDLRNLLAGQATHGSPALVSLASDQLGLVIVVGSRLRLFGARATRKLLAERRWWSICSTCLPATDVFG
jgi:hypothetical protein